MNVVVVGAGAVGAVVATALKRGGARLTFLVRPRYVDDVKRGLRMTGSFEELLMPDDVVGSLAELRHRPVDQVWICLPSTGVDEAWLGELAEAAPSAAVVDLCADGERRVRRVLGGRAVEGGVPFIAYQTPLPGVASEAVREPGFAVWLPPFLRVPLSGPHAAACAAALRAGGLGSRVVADAGLGRAIGTSFFNTVIAHLELADWKLAGCRKRLDGATAEALAITLADLGVGGGVARLLVRPTLLKLAMRLAPLLIPVPLEPYLAFHFTKVGAQTRRSLAQTVQKAAEQGRSVPQLMALHDALRQRHPAQV